MDLVKDFRQVSKTSVRAVYRTTRWLYYDTSPRTIIRRLLRKMFWIFQWNVLDQWEILAKVTVPIIFIISVGVLLIWHVLKEGLSKLPGLFALDLFKDLRNLPPGCPILIAAFILPEHVFSLSCGVLGLSQIDKALLSLIDVIFFGINIILRILLCSILCSIMFLIVFVIVGICAASISLLDLQGAIRRRDERRHLREQKGEVALARLDNLDFPASVGSSDTFDLDDNSDSESDLDD